VNPVAWRLGNWERAITWRVALSPGCKWAWLSALGAHLGDGALWAAAVGGLLIWGTPFARRLALVAFLAVLASAGAATAIKYIVRRPRPQERSGFYTPRYDRYSFPSGHAARMAAIAVVLGHLAPPLAPLGYGLALVVAVCRILVGVHYPSDVLAGWFIGWIGAQCILLGF
jgi:undecaprenyl-diphosphatase